MKPWQKVMLDKVLRAKDSGHQVVTATPPQHGGEVAASVVLAMIVAAIDKAEGEGAQRIKIETLRAILYVE